MKTRTSVKFGLVDVTAKGDSNLQVNNKQNFVNINDLKNDDLEEIKYGTLEKNQFALDGTFQLMDGSLNNMGWWSNIMSDENGQFSTPLIMEVNFSEIHSSLGLTFLFSKAGDYCNHLNIKFYDDSNNLMSSKDFYPNKYYFFCRDIAENYQRIVITFYSTNNPYRYLKLYKILYGAEIIFEGDNLINANILEEVNLLSSEVSINTLDFTCYSQDDDFNILNPQGAYKLLQQRQPFIVNKTLVKEDRDEPMGTFYLDTWESEKDKMMKFGAIDLLGIIDKTEFNGGMYVNKPVDELIYEIMFSAGLETKDYYIDSNLSGLTVTGYIPICTHREALQQVIFVIGAVADCSRSTKIKIYKVDNLTVNDEEITKSNILQGTKKIQQNTLVTGVSITAHDYTVNTEQSELFKGNLTTGITKIIFNEPVTNLSITGATIIDSNCNYANIRVNTTGEVIINGYKYIDNLQTYLVQINDLSAHQRPNILKIENATLVNKSNATVTAQRILNYYQNTYKIQMNIFLNNEKLTDNVKIEEDFEQELIGQISKLDINLTGGFISNIEMNAKVRRE